MVAKVLAGLLAAVAVTVVGVYAALGTSGDVATGSLPVSEGGCCAAKAQAASCCSLSASACCAHEGEPAITESVAACAGGAVLAVAADGHGHGHDVE